MVRDRLRNRGGGSSGSSADPSGTEQESEDRDRDRLKNRLQSSTSSDSGSQDDSSAAEGGGSLSRDEGLARVGPGNSEPVQQPDPVGDDPTDGSDTNTQTDSTESSGADGSLSRDEGLATLGPGNSEPVQPPEPVGDDPTDGSDTNTQTNSTNSSGGGSDPRPPNSDDELVKGGSNFEEETKDPEENTNGDSEDIDFDAWKKDIEEEGTFSVDSEDFDGLETEDSRIGEQAREVEQQVLQRFPYLDEGDVGVVTNQTDDGVVLEARLTEEARRDVRRNRISAYVINTTDAGRNDIESVELTGDGPRIEFSDEYRREQAVDQFVEESFATEDDVTAQVTDDGQVSVSLTQEARAERAVDTVSDRTGIPESEISAEPTEDGIRVSISEEVREERVREQVADDRGLPEAFVETEATADGVQVDIDRQAEGIRGRGLDDQDAVIPAGLPGTSEVSSEFGPQSGRVITPQAVARRAGEQLPEGFERGEEFRVVETDDGGYRAQLTTEGQQSLAEERAESQIASEYGLDEDEVFVDAEQRSTEEVLRSRQRARQSETADRVQTLDLEISRGTRERILEAQVAAENEDISREDVEAFRDSETGEFGVRRVDDGEEFGNFELGIPGTDRTVEGVTEGAGIVIQRAASNVGDVAGDIAAAPGRAVTSGASVPGADESLAGAFGVESEFDPSADAADRTADVAISSGVGRGANPFFFARGVDETAEFVAYSGEEIAAGRSGQLASDTQEAAVERGSAAVDQARENPLQTAAILGGSLLLTGGAIRAASSVGTRTAAATRFAIQPGEEILTGAATRVAGATTRGQRALSRLPGNRLGPEEVGTAAAVRARAGARSRARRVSEVLRGESSVSPTPRQSELVDRFRPGAARETQSADSDGEVTRETDAVAGARSEPLGSDTSDILDATVGTGQPGPRRFESETETESSFAGESEADENLPLREEIQEAGGARPFARGEDLPPRVPGYARTQSVRSLLRGERGQVQLSRSRSRRRSDTETETETDVTEPSVSPGDVQSDIQDVTLRQRRELSGDIESRSDPIGEATEPSIGRSRVTRSEVEQTTTPIRADAGLAELVDDAETPSVRSALRSGTGAEERLKAAQRSEATQAAQTPQALVEDLPLPQLGSGSGSRFDALADIGSRGRVGAFARTDQRTEVESEQRLQAAQETSVTPEAAPEGSGEAQGGTAPTPATPRTPFRTGSRPALPESESERSADGSESGFFPGEASAADGSLGTGWLSETVATIATRGTRTTEAPSEDVLEDQPQSAFLTGELPTALEVSGDEETQEAIDDVESLLSFGTGGSRR